MFQIREEFGSWDHLGSDHFEDPFFDSFGIVESVLIMFLICLKSVLAIGEFAIVFLIQLRYGCVVPGWVEGRFCGYWL